MQRMSKTIIARSLAAFTFALLCGCRSHLEEQSRTEDMAKTMNQTEPVVCAVKAVQQGEVVSSDMIEVRQVPSKDVPGGVLWTLDLAIGLVARHGFDRGCMLTTYYFGLDDSDPQFKMGLGEGYKRMERAMRRKTESKLRSGAP